MPSAPTYIRLRKAFLPRARHYQRSLTLQNKWDIIEKQSEPLRCAAAVRISPSSQIHKIHRTPVYRMNDQMQDLGHQYLKTLVPSTLAGAISQHYIISKLAFLF